MALQRQLFDHASPAIPTLTGGMRLGSSGVTYPPLQTIGSLGAISSADGSFSEPSGFGHIDFYNGDLYVFDSGNNRIMRFVRNVITGIWAYSNKVINLSTLLGGGSGAQFGLLAIDRSRGQIHVAYGDHTQTTGQWISVWNLSDFPNLTTVNRVRRYGNNSTSTDAVDRVLLGISMTVDDTFAIVCSALAPNRIVRWNHVTGAFQNSATKGATVSQFFTDGAGNWWAGAQPGADIVGLRKIDPATFGSLLRYDAASQTQLRAGQLSTSANTGVRPLYHNGRVYGRDYIGRVSAWLVAGTFLDDYLSPGGLASNNTLAGLHSPNALIGPTIYQDKGAVVISGQNVEYISWGHHANGSDIQSFLQVFPMTVATATWIKTNWSNGTNTIQSLNIIGAHVSGEKYKIRLRKNAGPWITFNSDTLDNAAFFASLGTFTEGDELEMELSLSTWDRLDFASNLHATRDKISPTNVRIELTWDDDSTGFVFIPQQTAALRGELAGEGGVCGALAGGGLRGRISE